MLSSRRGEVWWFGLNVPLWVAGLASLVCVVGVFGHGKGCWEVPGLVELELHSVDVRFRLRGPRGVRSDEVVIVGIDDKTRRQGGALFQTRRRVAEFVTRLGAYQPRAIGLDLLFESPEVVLPGEVLDEVRGAQRALAAVGDGDGDGDGAGDGNGAGDGDRNGNGAGDGDGNGDGDGDGDEDGDEDGDGDGAEDGDGAGDGHGHGGGDGQERGDGVGAGDGASRGVVPERLAPVLARVRGALDAVVEHTRGDEFLARAIGELGTVHLGVLFHLDAGGGAGSARVPEPAGVAGARYGEWVAGPGPRSERPPAAYAVSVAVPEIARRASRAGALNVLPDRDGNVRRVYGAIEHGGRYYVPLALSLAMSADSSDAFYAAGQRHIRVGDRELPVTRRGEFLLNYLGPRATFAHVSAADVVSGAAPRAALADKLVLVGFTDTARDKVATPFDPLLDGVEVHATLLHNILHGELLRRTGPGTTALLVALLGAAITLLQLRRVRRRRWWLAAAAAFVVVGGYLVVAHILFSAHGLLLEVAAPAVSGAFITLGALLAALATEGREKARLRAAFSQYVSDTLVERLLSDPRQATLGGRRRELTVLFSDIRSFATLAEKLDPETLSAYLSEYLTPMTELVMDEGGMLDKYIGDAIMAVYGAPIDMADHAERACHTALAMLRALEPLNARWADSGLPTIAIGIGLNTGPMSVGNMGSEARFDYTVLGDAVNLGARLEGLTKQYRVDILTGEDTFLQARERFVFREMDRVRVKGRTDAARIYELVARRGQARFDDQALALYGEALADYQARAWERAREGFSRFLERYPEDGAARVMLRRIDHLEADPPDESWDGVFEQVSK